MNEITFPGEYMATKLVMRGCCEQTFTDLYREARDVLLGRRQSEYFPDGADGEEMEDYLFALGARGHEEEKKKLETLCKLH